MADNNNKPIVPISKRGIDNLKGSNYRERDLDLAVDAPSIGGAPPGLFVEGKPTTSGVRGLDALIGVKRGAEYRTAATGLGMYLDLKKYTPYIDQVRLEHGIDAINKMRARNQSHLAQIGGFLNQAIVGEIIGGTIGSVGALLEVPEMIYNTIVGGRTDFDNMLIRAGDGIGGWARGATPIYVENPNQTFDWDDLGWWTSHGVSIASTLSMLIPARAATGGLSFASKLARMGAKSAKLAGSTDKLRRAQRLAATASNTQRAQRAQQIANASLKRKAMLERTMLAGSNLSQGTKNVIKAATGAAVMRHSENVRESFTIVNDTKKEARRIMADDKKYNELLETEAGKEYLAMVARLGGTPSKDGFAEFMGAEAGWRTYQVNSANIVFDFIQMGAIINPKLVTRGLKVSNKVKRKLAGKTKAPSFLQKVWNNTNPFLYAVGRQSTEGMEEAINFIGEKEGRYYADQMMGKKNPLSDTFGGRLATYMGDSHLWESAFWGTIGGMVFEGVGGIGSRKSNKRMNEMLMEQIAAREATIKGYAAEVDRLEKEAAKEGRKVDPNKLSKLRSVIALQMAIGAAETRSIDTLLAQVSHKSFKDSLLASLTEEEKNNFKEEAIDDIIGNVLSQVESVERIYRKAVNRFANKDVSNEIKTHATREYVALEFESEMSNQVISRSKNALAEIERNDKELKNHSNPHARKLLEIQGLEKYKQTLAVDAMVRSALGLEASKEQKALMAKADKQIAKLKKEITDAGGTIEKIELKNKDIMRHYTTWAENFSIIEHNDDLIAELVTDKGIARVGRSVETTKKKKEEAQEKQDELVYNKSIDEIIKKSGKLDTAIANLENELANLEDTDTKKKKYVTKKLKELKERQELLKKQGGQQGDTGDTGDTDVTDTETDIESKENLKDEINTDTINKGLRLSTLAESLKKQLESIVNKADTNENKLKKLKRVYEGAKYSIDEVNDSQEVKEAKLEVKRLIRKYYNAVASQRKGDVTSTSFQIGDKFTTTKFGKPGEEYIITDIFEDYYGDQRVLITNAESNEDNILLTEIEDSLSKGELSLIFDGGLTQNKKSKIQGDTLKAKLDNYVNDEIAAAPGSGFNFFSFTAEEFFNNFLSDRNIEPHILELFNNILKANPNLEIFLNIREDIPNTKAETLVDSTDNTTRITLYRNNIKDLSEEDVINIVLAHELIHVGVESSGIEAAELNKILANLLDKSLKSSEISDEMKGIFNKDLEELLTYYLTDANLLAKVLGDIELFTALNDAIENLPDNLKETVKNIYQATLFKARSISSAGPKAIKKITPAAKKLANDYNINYDAITGTGVNGNITKDDVKQYILDNNISLPIEIENFLNEDLDVQSKPTATDSNNIFISFIEHGIKDGKVDAAHYNAIIRKKFGIEANVTQEELEKTIQTILSPTLNVGSKVKLVLGSNGSINIETMDGVVIGFLNTAESTQKRLEEAEKVFESSIEELEKMEKEAEAKSDYATLKAVRWRLSELNGTSSNKDFATHIDLLKSQLYTIKEIKKNIYNILKSDPFAEFVTTVTRKSSGNLSRSQTEEFNLDTIYPGIDELYMTTKETGKHTTLYSNKDGKEFKRDPDATNFHNDDGGYDSGKVYMLVAGANTNPNLVNTFIPVPLTVNNISEEAAAESYDLIMKLVEKAQSLLAKGVSGGNILNNEDILDLKKELKDYFNINEGADKAKGDYMQIHSDYIEFSFTANSKYYKSRVYFKSKFEDAAQFEIKEMVNETDSFKDGKIIKRDGGKGNKVKTLSSKNHAEKFKENILGALKQKRHNINQNRLQDTKTPYKGEKNYARYLIKKGILTTNLITLKDGNGKQMKDLFGNPLPSVTGKNSYAEKNNNLVVSIDTKVESSKPTSPVEEETTAPPATEETTDTTDTTDTIEEFKKSLDVNMLLSIASDLAYADSNLIDPSSSKNFKDVFKRYSKNETDIIISELQKIGILSSIRPDGTYKLLVELYSQSDINNFKRSKGSSKAEMAKRFEDKKSYYGSEDFVERLEGELKKLREREAYNEELDNLPQEEKDKIKNFSNRSFEALAYVKVSKDEIKKLIEEANDYGYSVVQEGDTFKVSKMQTTETTDDTTTETSDTGKLDLSIINLLMNREIIVDDGNIAYGYMTNPKVIDKLEDNEFINIVQLADGRVKVTIETGGARMKAVQDSDTKTEDVRLDEAKVKAWWQKTFGGNIPLDMNFVGMIENGGQLAWGLFQDAMVKLSKSAKPGTEFHEAFHVVFWVYLDSDQRKDILSEIRKKYPTANAIQLEEYLADDYMDYMLKKGETTKVEPKSLIGKLFNMLYNWVTKFFRKNGYAGENGIQRLFEDIDAGKFNYKPDAQSLEYAKKITRNKVVDGYSRQQEAEIISLLAKLYIEFADSNMNTVIRELKSGQILDPKAALRANLASLVPKVSANKRENIVRVLRDLDNFYPKVKAYVARQFQIEATDIVDVEAIAEIEKKWDDTSIFGTSSKDSVNNYIKKVIMTTAQSAINSKGELVSDTNTFLGLETFLDFNKVYPYIQRNMLGARTIQEMMLRLENMTNHDASISRILEKLKTDSNFRAAWFSSFHKQSPQKFAVLIEGSENGSTVKVEQSNKNTSHYLLSNEWKNNFLTKIENGEFNKDMFAQMKELITNIERMSSGNNPAREFENNAVDIIENLVTAFDLLGVNLTEEQLAKTFSNSVLRQRFGTAYNMYNQIFREALRRLSGEINAYNKLALDKKSEYKFNSLNRLNQVSQIVNLFQYDFIESSFFDVNGNNVYSSTNPNYLSNFFEAISAATDITYINQQAAKESLLTMLMEYASNPAMAYSNWLWDSGNNDGALLDDGTKNIDNLTVESLNLDFLKRFSFGMLDGIKNLNTRNSEQYNNMSDASWKVTQLVMYLQTGDRTTARVPILIPSDSGNIGFITTNRIRAQLENGKLVKGSQLHTALMNTLMQEYQRMVDARDLLFRKVEAEDGLIEYVPKEHMSYESAEYNSDLHVDYHKLEKGYHFNKFDSNNMPIIADKDNNATGKVFKFYNMEEANNLDIFQQKMIMHSNNPEAFTDMLMENFETVVDNFVSQQIAKGMAIFGNRSKNGKVTKVQAQGHIMNMEEFQRYDSFNQLIAEFMLNSYINNVEQFNFLIGEHAEYKHNKDTNKRAKEIISPVVSISTELAGETFTAATLADVDLMSSIFDNIATNIAEGIKRENPKLKKQKLNLKEIRKESPDTSKLNELSKATLEIVGGYKYITTADAQGYVSLDRYEAIVKGAGRWNDSYATLFETVRRGERLNGQQLGLFLQPLKGFYYARKFDPYLKKHVSSQIKYSSVPLIPQLVQGSNIEKLSKWMQENNLDEVFFESAQKVGATNIISITDKNGKINDEALSRFHVANGYRHRRYSNDSWGIQLDVPDHLMDTDNLLGSQIAKLILSNLPAGNTYQVGTDQYSTEEFIEHYFDVIATNIQEDAESLLERMGVVEDILPNGESVFSIPNKEKIYELLKGEVERRGLSDNYQEAIELVEIQGFENKDFNMPLFTSHLAKKWESILTSMFTNNVTNQRLPGGSAVLLSSLFIADKAAAEADTDQAKPTVTTVDEVDQTGINWLNSKKESGDYTLKMTNISPDGKVVAAEILLPAWSKKFYKEVETGKDADGNPTYEYVLDDINNVPKELRTMLWYRIPSEEKYSMVFAEVVGFLPQAMGSTIVMPHEIVTSTGADFDVDKKFGALRQFDVIQNIDGTREYKMNEFTNDTEVLFEQWLNSKQARELRKALKENPTEELKRIKTQVDRFNTRATNIFNQRQALFAANKEQIETVEKEFLTELTELLNLNNELSSIKDAYSTVFSTLKEVREDLDIINGMYSKTSINLNPEEDAQAQAQQAAYNQQIKQLNQILSMINEYVEESRAFREGAVEDIEHFKTMNTRANEVYKDYLERYRAQKIATLRQEFERELAATGVNRMNNRKARDNRIIDLWMSVLSNPMHYKDTLSPQSFSDGVDAMYELRDLLKEDSGNINPMTAEGQLHFRKQNISGRALKGMAADSNAFLTIAQVSKMELRKDLGFQVKYDLDTYNKEDLERKYGKGEVVEDENGKKSIIITHTQLGWNQDGSFDNVDGKTTTAHASQMLAMILDIVKEGIPDNVNTYTFFPFITMLNTGINIRYASLFIRQPILNDLSELVLSNNGAFGTSNNTEIQEIKTRYQESLFSLKQKRGDYDAITDKDDRARYEQALFRKQEGNFTIFPNDTFFLLGYDVNQITPFSTEELVDSYGLYNKVRSKSSLDEKINFITMQLQVLENYKTYRKAGEAYTDATITFNADKLGAGPSLYKTENLNRNIKKATYYNKLHTEKEEGKPISYTEKSEGARILINTPELGKVPATMAVYTDSFTPQEIFEYLNDVANRDVSLDKIKANKIASKYRILEVYKKYANDLSIDVLKSEFIHQSNSFKELMNQITTITGLPYSENLQNNVLSYLTHQLIKEHPFFENIDFARLVGVSTPKVFTLDISQSVIKKQPHFKKDMEMAQESTKAIAKVTKAKSSKYNSSTASYLTALGESVTGINNEFTESDVVWVFGAGEWASSKEDIQKDFDEYYKAQIDAALEAGVSRFNIGKATGIDSLATKYLRKKGFKVKTKRGYYFIYNPSVTSANAESTKVITDTDISFEEFAELSAPNKLLIVKRMMKEDLQNDSHILNYLMPKLDNQTINKNGTHGISFVNTKTDMLTDDRLTDSFVEMFYSDNVFVADLARDLIAYNFASTGFEMKADSYSKLIPTSILSEVLGLGNFLRDVGNKMINVDYISSRYPNFVDNFLRSNSHNSKIVPFVETKWSNGIGSKTMNNTPIWNANQDGVITVLSTQLNKESMAVKSAEYITIPVIKTVNTKNGEIAVREGTKLYKKYGAVGRQVVKKKGKEQVEQTIFDIKYYEVSKLGGRNLIEYSETVLPSNEAQFSETEYIDNIENNRVLSSDLIKLRETNPSAYNLVMNSKDFIGDSRTLQKMFKSKKTFEVGENVLSLSNKGLENILSKGKLTGNFKKVYQALASEANILTTADNAIDQHLKTFSDKNQLIRYVTPQGYVAYTKAVSNLDIGAWQRKVLSPIEQEMLDNNKDINPNGKC